MLAIPNYGAQCYCEVAVKKSTISGNNGAGASGNIDDRSVRAFAVKPRAFGNAAMRRWLTARRGQADLVLAADHRVMADTNPTTVLAAIAPANTRISPPAACAVQYSTRPRVQHRAISRCHDGASGRRQR